ncbi:Uncharacterised protein [Salmonella enterica subsp. enterica serovar Daytona]|uniref:Uncharacterized protein n=1 Tax=Salmonella enterica subsp. enterica serovar Daytona TaxID=1962639 RepID=A0A447JAB6_SALET|nr:Uncharacterised protein [Salmonella enterica subsp. enterica serovar Daytona]
MVDGTGEFFANGFPLYDSNHELLSFTFLRLVLAILNRCLFNVRRTLCSNISALMWEELTSNMA